jgi:hypothetical protein
VFGVRMKMTAINTYDDIGSDRKKNLRHSPRTASCGRRVRPVFRAPYSWLT